jgi:hypothetical protein
MRKWGVVRTHRVNREKTESLNDGGNDVQDTVGQGSTLETGYFTYSGHKRALRTLNEPMKGWRIETRNSPTFGSVTSLKELIYTVEYEVSAISHLGTIRSDIQP